MLEDGRATTNRTESKSRLLVSSIEKPNERARSKVSRSRWQPMARSLSGERALCIAAKDDPDKQWRLAKGRRDILGWQEYEDDARAALNAASIPTAAMCQAACDAGIHLNITPEGWSRAYQAMMASALTVKES